MGLHTKILHKVKTIVRRESSRAGHPPEINVPPDLLIAPGPLPGGGTHAIRPNSPGEGMGRDIQTANDERWGAGDNSAMPTHNCRAAASNNNDRELLGPSAWQPPMGHSPSESIRFDDINHSGISIGGGPVNVTNTSFSGGTFIHNHNPSERMRPGFEFLQKRVATSAFHNSAQRVDPPRCHPDTRVAIQNQIYSWILTDLLIRQTWIMWMHGAAGAGKSAIMQSIAELCERAQIPLASFFFFRTDDTRNSMASFIATLVYQLIQKIPQARDEIFKIIEDNPFIFDQSLESQLQELIIQPLLRVQTHFNGFFVVLVDGLDELCTKPAPLNQVDLIQSLGTISRSRAIPVIFLITSRREPQIEAAFVRKEVSNLVLTLPLDNSDIEQTSDDIRCFLVNKFRDIKETHLLKHHLSLDWPLVSFIEEIVSKSSGQFIFASVIVNYLSSPRANPAHQLEVVRGIRLRDPSLQNPFAHLDALYEYIFSRVGALGKVLDIIGYVIAGGFSGITHIQKAFLLEAGELDVLFADLTAVILCEPNSQVDPKLKFLHASLPDFLVDKSRSKQYHIDLDEHRTYLLCGFLERHPPILDPLWSDDDLEAIMIREWSRLSAIRNLLKKATASERLRSAFMNFNCTFYSETMLKSSRGWDDIGPNILRNLKQLDFSDQGKAYRHVMDMFAAEYAKYWPSRGGSFKQFRETRFPDLMIRINQIRVQAT